jgi:hypothetical protein
MSYRCLRVKTEKCQNVKVAAVDNPCRWRARRRAVRCKQINGRWGLSHAHLEGAPPSTHELGRRDDSARSISRKNNGALLFLLFLLVYVTAMARGCMTTHRVRGPHTYQAIHQVLNVHTGRSLWLSNIVYIYTYLYWTV